MALSKITDLSITDDTIKNADINSSAAIALTKLSGGIDLAASGAGGVTGILPVANGGTATTSYTAGITVADQWRLTTAFTGTATPIASNLERIDTSGQGTIGSAMTESSGIFTFPSTGIYLVEYRAYAQLNGDSRYNSVDIDVTINDTDYNMFAESSSLLQSTSSSVGYMSIITSTYIDVTDVSNVKCRFDFIPESSSVECVGSTVYNATTMTFIRLGDT